MKKLYVLNCVAEKIHCVDTQTGEYSDLLDGLTDTPDGIAAHEGKLYWTNMGRPDPVETRGEDPLFKTKNGSLQCLDLSNQQIKTLVPVGTFTTGKQLALDTKHGYIYWCDREGESIYRCRFDGSGLSEQLVTRGRSCTINENECVGIALDVDHGYLYWTQKGPPKSGHGRIFRASLTISEGQTAEARTDIETLWQGLPEPINLHIDVASQVIYWTDRGLEPYGNSLNRAPIPAKGQPGRVPTVLSMNFKEAIGLVLDEEKRLVYVSDLSGEIREVDLARGMERVLTTLPGPLTGITLY